MKTRIVTLMWGTAWDRYGETFCRTFHRYWGGDPLKDLFIVTCMTLPYPCEQMSYGKVPELDAFIARSGWDSKKLGYGSKDRKADPKKRFWKHDAVKWAPQGMAPLAAMDGMEDGDLLAWFDADVEFVRDVPTGWINVLLDGHDLVHLGREPQHSEIGFWAIRISEATRAFVNEFSDIYASDRVFSYDEWHSGYIFDRARENVPGMKTKSLSRGKGHVWPNTVLAKYTVHKKGKLKDL